MKKDKEAIRLFYKDGFARLKSITSSEIDKLPSTVIYASSTSLIDRLRANMCEIAVLRTAKLKFIMCVS